MPQDNNDDRSAGKKKPEEILPKDIQGLKYFRDKVPGDKPGDTPLSDKVQCPLLCPHMTLKTETPAMASGIENHVWTIRELIEESAKF